MLGRAVLGQLAAVAGSGLLLIFVPFMPSVWGLPRERVAEMCVFWVGSCLLLCGLEAGLAAFIQNCRNASLTAFARRIGVYAVASAILGTASCLATLSILLITSLDGAGLIPDDELVSGLRRPLRYAVALPLLVTFVCQCLSLGTLRMPPASSQPAPRRTMRTCLLVLLVLALLAFAGALLLFLANRWFAMYVVVVTWLTQCLFVALAIEQTAFLVRELTPPHAATHDVPSPDYRNW
jgi:hypothetical protein